MPITTDPLITLTQLLRRNSWEVQLAGTPTSPTTTRCASRGVAYVVPALTLQTNGDLR